MKKAIITFLFLSFIITINAQIDYSIFLKKKVSKKDLVTFTNMTNFKKHNYSKCLKGNCKNGKSLLKQSFRIPKYRLGNGLWSSNKIDHTILIEGMFKNGKLNGEAAIYYYNKFYYNEKKNAGVFSNNRDVLANTDYSECIKGKFKNNVIANGEYIVKVKNSWNKKILMNISKKLNFRNYFSDFETRRFSKRFNARSLLSFYYKGKFKSLSTVNENDFEKLVLLYAAGNFTSNWDDKYYITIKPQEKENTFDFTQKINKTYSKTIITNPKVFTIVNGECDGCWLSNMTLAEHKQHLIDNQQKRDAKALAEKEHQLALKVKRAKSLVGHFVEKYNVYYCINNYDSDGCVYGNRYPTTAYYQKDHIPFFNDCQPKKFTIIKNGSVCPNCKGWGKEDVKVTYNTTYYTKDNVGNRTYDKSPSRSGTVVEKHSCNICKGKGVIIK